MQTGAGLFVAEGIEGDVHGSEVEGVGQTMTGIASQDRECGGAKRKGGESTDLCEEAE